MNLLAGDIAIEETVLVSTPPQSPEEASAIAAALSPPGVAPPRVLHRYGRLTIVGGEPAALAGLTGPGASGLAARRPEALTDLDEAERLGLAAFRLRDSPAYLAAKQRRPGAGEPWNMVDCLPGGTAPAALLAEAEGGDAGATPTSGYFEGSVAVGLVVVSGPGDLAVTPDEQTKIVAEVQNGLSFHASANPAADMAFTYDLRIVQLSLPANPSAPDLEAYFRDPAMAALGFAANFSGVQSYVSSLRTRFGTRWSYCAFFTKYPLSFFAYSAIGGPRLVIQYQNDGWGPDNIDRVFAHETGHIFGCPDEYTGSGCDCDGAWGRFRTVNGNCQTCAPGGGETCLMRSNDFSLCSWTPSHVGWARGVGGSGTLLQSRFGRQGNFELAMPSAFRGIDHVSRNNDALAKPWGDPVQFGHAAGKVDAVSMIQSSFDPPGNLELVARVGDQLRFFWRDSGPTFRWRGPTTIRGGVAGSPALIQSRFGSQGNFEVVVPASGGGMLHLVRFNDLAGRPWSDPTPFGGGLGQVDAVTMIQSNFESPGNLEVIARAGAQLSSFWRDSGPGFVWHGPTPVTGRAAGVPVLIQSRFGSQGNFELVAPSADAGLLHLFRANDLPEKPWSEPVRFGQSLGRVDAVTMIQSNLDPPGNLELVARAGGRLYFFWRDSGPAFTWRGPTRIL